jgi:hypothetical protein
MSALFKKNQEVNIRNRVQNAYYIKVLRSENRNGKYWYLLDTGYHLDPKNPDSDIALNGQWYPEESLMSHQEWKTKRP